MPQHSEEYIILHTEDGDSDDEVQILYSCAICPKALTATRRPFHGRRLFVLFLSIARQEAISFIIHSSSYSPSWLDISYVILPFNSGLMASFTLYTMILRQHRSL